MEYWPNVNNKTPIIQREFRGVSTLDPFSIAPEFASEVKNLTSSKYPAASTRPGYSVVGTFGTGITGLGVWKDSELHILSNDGKWRRLNADGTTTDLASGLNTIARFSFCNFKGGFTDINLIGTNGVDSAKRYDGTTVQNLSGAPANLNYIEQHDNRLYGMVGNQLYFSELSVATNWTVTAGNDSDPGIIVVESAKGETTNGLLAGEGHIIVYKPSKQSELFGTSPSDFRVIEVADDIGLANNSCKAVLSGIVYQMDRNGIYSYTGGARPDKRFSLPVQKYIDALTTSDLANCAMGTDGQKLYTYIPGKILEYDPKFQTWYVWEDISAVHFARVGASFYVGDTLGRLLKFGGSTDAGTPITGNWISKPFTAESMSQVIRWIRAWITANVPTGSSMNIYLSKSADGNDWVKVGNVAATNQPIYISSNALPNAKMLRVKIEFSGPVDIYEFSREENTMPVR